MKTKSTFRLLPALMLALFVAIIAKAQTTPPKVYSEVYYHKLKPGHTFAEARAIENEFKKIHQVQADEGFIRGWYMLSLNTTTNPNSEYDYITVKSFTDLAYLDNNYPEATLKKGWGNDYQVKTTEVMKRMGEVKQVVKTEMWETIERAAANPLPKADKSPIWFVTYMKVKNGQYQVYTDKVKKLQPYLQEFANMGTGYVSWGVSGLLFPWANEKPYDFASVEHYTSLKAYIESSSKAEAAFKKALPDVDRTQFYKELNAIREPARQEVYYLLEYAEKSSSDTVRK